VVSSVAPRLSSVVRGPPSEARGLSCVARDVVCGVRGPPCAARGLSFVVRRLPCAARGLSCVVRGLPFVVKAGGDATLGGENPEKMRVSEDFCGVKLSGLGAGSMLGVWR